MLNAAGRPSEPCKPPRPIRAGISITCEVRQGTRVWRMIRLDNLSCEGFRLAWSPDITMDLPLRLKIPGIQLLTARIRWRTRSAIGCQFYEPLHVAVFEHLLKNAPG